jgi:hypothetical protein
MRSSGHLLKRAGTEFAKHLLWMAVVFGSLAAILAAVTYLSLLEVMAFVGVFVVVMAAIVTAEVILSGTRDKTTHLSGHDYPGASPHRGGDLVGGVWGDGGGGADGGGGGG